MQFQHDGGPLFGAQVGVGSDLFHGNTSYGDGVLHLKVESKDAIAEYLHAGKLVTRINAVLLE